ncbi:mannose-6-phosphate isomerase [Kineococcus rubinsiae]|uniref:mannose-6-phosphate isomerase n=1 Tax=Kineococcus rubinsiae TaxID=2609562 RepID=UPI00142FF664|nr:mannose-6-phosphate isomerase [Kineococcus rubinsiae]NIZ91621.1 mannose-6-phosphate isomerase [Kineococcus rubinsiae]
MIWYPLRLATSSRSDDLGGRAIADVLGRSGLPDGPVLDSSEVSDDAGALVSEGVLAGTSLRTLVAEHPEELVGPGWRGDRFPLSVTFVDGSGALPVHVRPAAAGRRAGAGAGTPPEDDATGTWHVLAAASGASAWCGVREGTDADALRAGLLADDVGSVLRTLPVSAGDTVLVPGGAPHCFGPGTLLYEIQPGTTAPAASLLRGGRHGSPGDDPERRAAVEAVVRATRADAQATVRGAVAAAGDDGVRRLVCCDGPSVGLQRWRSAAPVTVLRRFASVQVLSNLGDPVRVRTSTWDGELGRARSLVLPAALGRVHLQGRLDLLIGHLPTLRATPRSASAPGEVAVAGRSSAR